jgi:sulfur carrier protein ThiS adenylyltransferase
MEMTQPELLKILSTKSAGIAGCGGLGSNCAVALARTGVGKLIIADFDVVSEENLSRQYFFRDQVGMKKVEALKENIARINPEIIVECHDMKMTKADIPAIFRSCDVVVEAFDLADQKKMLIETVLSAFPEKPLVIGLGIAGWGENSAIQCRKSDNLYICGDEVSEISTEMPPLAPRVGIVANMQANVVIEILLKRNA